MIIDNLCFVFFSFKQKLSLGYMLSSVVKGFYVSCHIQFLYLDLQKLTTALEQTPDDAEHYCQRAYAHILLQNYLGNIS